MNLYQHDLLNAPLGLLASLLLGLLFGFWLERSGFGSSRKLTSIFYFRDFAVLKVMFTAMAVAALSLQALAAFGAVDTAQLFVPDTVVGAQAVGGVLFGLGFVIGGFCPGTAAVGLGSGHIDALVFLVGAGGGSLLFAGVADRLQGLRSLGACGTCALSDTLGLTPIAGAVGLAVVALLAFVLAHWVEAKMRTVPEATR
jgi:uncharacterized membrane protein YedE/YeeE